MSHEATRPNVPKLERCLVAGVYCSLFAVVSTVGLASALARWALGEPINPPLIAALAILVSLGLALLAHQGKGPLLRFAAWLPEPLDGAFGRRRLQSWLAAVLLVIGVLQIARLSCFMADDRLTWGSAYPPTKEGVEHMCQSAYVHAADLARRGEPNIYAERHYPAYSGGGLGDREARVSSPVDNIEPYLDDPYEYPPQFLMVPRAALLLSNDYQMHRTLWFVLQTLAFLSLALALTRWLRPKAGTVALLLLPGMLGSLPGMFTLQFGQWHLATIMLSIGGMLAFVKSRNVLGGALLAAGIVTKIFPGLLGLYLLAQKRWTAAAWTFVFSLLYSVLALAALGWAPFETFFTYHLPRISSGEAFSFFLDSYLTLAANYGVYGIPFKLQALGVPGMGRELASNLALVYGLALLGLTVLVARRAQPVSDQLGIWLALLVLASLRSPLAPNVYIAAPGLWLLTWVAADARGKAWKIALVVVAWITMGGLPPMPTPNLTIGVWMTGQISILALGIWVTLRACRSGVVERPGPALPEPGWAGPGG